MKEDLALGGVSLPCEPFVHYRAHGRTPPDAESRAVPGSSLRWQVYDQASPRSSMQYRRRWQSRRRNLLWRGYRDLKPMETIERQWSCSSFEIGDSACAFLRCWLPGGLPYPAGERRGVRATEIGQAPR